MTWTTEAPTQNGYYWAMIDKPHCCRDARIVLVLLTVGGHPLVYDNGKAVNLLYITHWQGPIATPEKP